ncbi:MAG: hypothetical protein Homavirus23_7 [Homavirus sp.]|uniref:N-acetyltransferase domain-containing protein n=1 Tax=Homavirus sp. TaxID=2487769 RepID=A0A3G5A4X2_9VIRU|nr:MAG: hypothetical protein Homavirus23_7 [Homavirus sp.]
MLQIKLLDPEDTTHTRHTTHTIYKLHEKLTNEKLGSHPTYIFYDNNKFVGYIVLIYMKNHTIKIDWIYGPKYGKQIMKKMERLFKKENIKKIVLNVSIDPNEQKKTVMRRINFYISLNYRVYDIIFRPKYGPLLKMEKYL